MNIFEKQQSLLKTYGVLLRAVLPEDACVEILKTLPTQERLKVKGVKGVFHPFGERLGDVPNDAMMLVKQLYLTSLERTIRDIIKVAIHLNTVVDTDGEKLSNALVKALGLFGEMKLTKKAKVFFTDTTLDPKESPLLKVYLGRHIHEDSRKSVVTCTTKNNLSELLEKKHLLREHPHFGLKDKKVLIKINEALLPFDLKFKETTSLTAPYAQVFFESYFEIYDHLLEIVNVLEDGIGSLKESDEIELDEEALSVNALEQYDELKAALTCEELTSYVRSIPSSPSNRKPKEGTIESIDEPKVEQGDLVCRLNGEKSTDKPSKVVADVPKKTNPPTESKDDPSIVIGGTRFTI